MNYYEFSNPNECEELLSTYKTFNDPIRQFAEEILPKCVWDLLPYSFLYDLYKAWFKENCPSGQMQSKLTFKHDLVKALANSDEWEIKDTNTPIKPGNKMDKTEYMIYDYNLTAWMNPLYKSFTDINLICKPKVASSYRGCLLRK